MPKAHADNAGNIEKKPIRLLKRTKVTDKGTFHNLFIQLGDGYPIAIDLPQKLFNIKVKNLLLANAEEFETCITPKADPDKDEKDF